MYLGTEAIPPSYQHVALVSLHKISFVISCLFKFLT